ncbi:PREDICTED: cyclin-dependent kinase inhibitor 4-like [Ipomoea nil]|uniref:cyclin-dependent kinase inhibitor 4-like n=1 Tax=Ipomoea nil TaxID=35883 RepID=UPI000901F2ED|nr:PREDICTED: cyclin-dependent kinase inhibitor 4-like [Ipomoea nil]
MGKYLTMSNGAEEEVAEIGVKTKRAREEVDAGEEMEVVKRRKIGEGEGEGELKPLSPSPAPALLQLENSVAPESWLDHAINQSSELSLKNLEFVDLEEEADGFRTPKRNPDIAESEKMPPFLARLVPPRPFKFRLISKSIPKNYPFAADVEFFAAEEQKRLREFSEKYNFDFENEEPMEGRYEWVKLLGEPAMKVADEEEESADEIPVASSAMKVADEDSSGDEVSLI